MLNLLPEESKNKIKKEYLFRRFSVILVFTSFLFIIFSILILPTYLAGEFTYKELSEKNESIKMTITKLSNEGKDQEASLISENLTALFSRALYHKPTEVIAHIESSMNSGITLSALTYQALDSERFSIEGVADTRENLVAFRKSLEKDTFFASVDLPITDIGPKINNKFSIKLVIVPYKK